MHTPEYLRRWRESRVDRGICVRCGNGRPEKNKMWCSSCLERSSFLSKKRRQARIKKRLCTICGETKANRGITMCEDCRVRTNLRLGSYDLSTENYQQLRKLQKNACAICREPSRVRELAVDHDHVTNKIRGLLCSKCNMGLGMFKDSIDRLRAAVDYLSKYS